jgi:mono/diheme cytochrome c family protein
VKDPDILPQQARENPEPQERLQPMPWPLVALTALLVAFGIVYIALADIETPAAWGDGRNAAELSGTPAGAGAKVDGAALYASLCAACHQANGQGLAGVFPPLAGAEWVTGKDSTAAAIVLHGVSGPLTVKGQAYNGAMPAFGGQLDDAQIAAVLSHVRSQWGNSAPAVSPATVAGTRAEHARRTTPFAGGSELPPHQ